MVSPRRTNPPTRTFLFTLLLLAAGLSPLPSETARAIRQSARSHEPNRAERESQAGSYYEGLINVTTDSSRNELALRLLGRPSGWLDFEQVGATRYLRDDILQFELLPNLRKQVLGRPFSTNRLGMRDREYPRRKPSEVTRIALVGASVDMGWGVGDDETYENLLEDWLNAHARRRGLDRHYEVMNWSMAAYSPLHRLEAFRRKAAEFQPDLVLHAVTLLDPRLLELHLCGLIRDRIDTSRYPTVARTIATAGIPQSELRRDDDDRLIDRDRIKRRFRPLLWTTIDELIGEFAGECRSRDIPMAAVIVPRAGDNDRPAERGPGVARYRAIFERHGWPILDLSATFDNSDPAAVEIAAWDDHPNALGHKLLFEALARRLVQSPELDAVLFTPSGGTAGPEVSEP